MGERTEQLKDQIESQREELGENLHQLEHKVKDTMDWRAQFEQRPMAGLGIAFAGGFLLSMALPSGRSDLDDHSRSRDMRNYRVYDESHGWRGEGTDARYATGFSSQQQQPKRQSAEMREVNETVENIRGAMMGLAATRLRGFLAETIPGFSEEYEQARRKRGNSEETKIQSDGGDSSRSTSSQGWSSQEARSSGESSTSSRTVPQADAGSESYRP